MMMLIFPIMTAAEMQRKVAEWRILSDKTVQWTLPVHCLWWKLPHFGGGGNVSIIGQFYITYYDAS